MGEYSARSNDPRITGGAKKDVYKYDMALEVARQKAVTPQQKAMQKQAIAYVKAFESRFQNEAFERSGRDPYTAGTPRSQGGVTPKSKTVNKLYRPSK